MWSVAVDAPLPTALTYAFNHEQPQTMRGRSVLVPLGRRKVHGVLMAPTAQPEASMRIKSVESLIEERPQLHESYLTWLEWLAKYYAHPIGQVVEMAFPPLLKKGGRTRKGAIVADEIPQPKPTLTDEQNQVYTAISQSSKFAVHLLFGVTGSGKTEVYLRLIQDVLARGQQVIVLVPEISLTPQLVQRFAARFGHQVAVIHSHLTTREKTNQWWQVIDGHKQILIGARSALFCPAANLGLIVVDEEHESSFKQEEMLKYHARDAAVMLAKFSDCPIVLGSATPSLESWKNASEGRYQLHEMRKRVENRPMPNIEVVDLRSERQARSEQATASELPFWLSKKLYTAMHTTLDAGDQCALFLNRRGMAQSLTCESCGQVSECPNCAISLTVHATTHLVCHYCGYHENRAEICAHCLVGEPKTLGVGTELIEQDLKRLFPQARVARADRDEIQSREALEELISGVEKREIDILVGTQMIAKGLDFPGLNLVGLVLADVGFNIPDFRASERAFQLMTQMSGRAGRHVRDDHRGQVIIQTYNPTHPGITYTCQHDFVGFAEYELQARRELGYPPYGRLAAIRIQGNHQSQVLQASLQTRQRALQMQQRHPQFAELEILGPVEAPLFKLRGKFRYHLLAKAPQALTLGAFCAHLCSSLQKHLKGVRLQVDVDPYNMM
jgi:primosomal protein N' (replication factor Y)